MSRKYFHANHDLNRRSKLGFPFDDKKASKSAKAYSCSVCLDGSARHCMHCADWMERVSGTDCHCAALSGSAELVKVSIL
jgi:hypothetical protein